MSFHPVTSCMKKLEWWLVTVQIMGVTLGELHVLPSVANLNPSAHRQYVFTFQNGICRLYLTRGELKRSNIYWKVSKLVFHLTGCWCQASLCVTVLSHNQRLGFKTWSRYVTPKFNRGNARLSEISSLIREFENMLPLAFSYGTMTLFWRDWMTIPYSWTNINLSSKINY